MVHAATNAESNISKIKKWGGGRGVNKRWGQKFILQYGQNKKVF